MYKLEYIIPISCGHWLKDTPSLFTKKCLRHHGHTFKVKIIIESNRTKNGMVIDFGILKKIIMEYDHQTLNDFLENPTTENLAKRLYNKIKKVLSVRGGGIAANLEVKIWETEHSCVTYNGKSL